jgi:hypothetical protein
MHFEPIRLTPDVLPLDVRRAGMALLRQAHARGTRSICSEARALIAASRKRIIRGEDLIFRSALCLAEALQQAQEVMQASAQRHG